VRKEKSGGKSETRRGRGRAGDQKRGRGEGGGKTGRVGGTARHVNPEESTVIRVGENEEKGAMAGEVWSACSQHGACGGRRGQAK